MYRVWSEELGEGLGVDFVRLCMAEGGAVEEPAAEVGRDMLEERGGLVVVVVVVVRQAVPSSYLNNMSLVENLNGTDGVQSSF